MQDQFPPFISPQPNLNTTEEESTSRRQGNGETLVEEEAHVTTEGVGLS